MTDRMKIAKRALRRACRLRVFRRELEDYGIELRPEMLELIEDSSNGGVSGKAGFSGHVRFSSDCNRVALEQTIVHELCHIVLWRVARARGLRGTERNAWKGHGQNFRGLLLAACAEYFRLSREDQQEIMANWQLTKVMEDVNHKELIANGYRPGSKRISAYMLDDCIRKFVNERKNREEVIK